MLAGREMCKSAVRARHFLVVTRIRRAIGADPIRDSRPACRAQRPSRRPSAWSISLASSPAGDQAGISPPDYVDYRSADHTFEQMAVLSYSPSPASLTALRNPLFRARMKL